MVKHQQPAKCQAGFTLVELAIVMIIIGLLIGGVLKGQQLITNAQITATVAQIKSIDAATTSFRDQYAGMPGDLVAPQLRLQGCTVGTNCGIPGDGDGKVDNGASIDFSAIPTNEQLGYWAQLNSAGLLTGINPGAAIAATAWSQYAPASKVSGGGFDIGWYTGGVAFPAGSNQVAANVLSGHYMALHGTAAAAMAATAADGFLTANLAARIDTKIDDGLGNTGTVQAGGLATCTNAAGVYAENLAGAQCSLYIQFQN